MKNFLQIMTLFSRWRREESGLAATEAALIFPVMLIMLLGIVDAGNAIVLNQKALRASQVVADLVARGSSVSAAGLNEAVIAGRLAFEPFDATSYGVDIVSVRFDEDENPQIVWRETVNMMGVANPLDRVQELSAPNEGAVMVAVQYVYEPIFGDFIIPTITMSEIAFARGRNSSVVNLQ